MVSLVKQSAPHVCTVFVLYDLGGKVNEGWHGSGICNTGRDYKTYTDFIQKCHAAIHYQKKSTSTWYQEAASAAIVVTYLCKTQYTDDLASWLRKLGFRKLMYEESTKYTNGNGLYLLGMNIKKFVDKVESEYKRLGLSD